MRISEKAFFAIATLLFVLLLSTSHAQHPLARWTPQGPLPTFQELTSLTHAESIHIIAFGDPSGTALLSEDGATFTPVPLGLPDSEVAEQILHSRGQWLLRGTGSLWTKEQWNLEWIPITSITDPVVGIATTSEFLWAWTGGFFEGTGSERQWIPTRLFYSSDADTWQEASMGTSPDEHISISEIIEFQGRLVLANTALFGTSGLYSSTDAATWQSVSQTGNTIYTLAEGNGTLLASGKSGTIYSTEDGDIWTTSQYPYVVAYIGNGHGTPSPQYASPIDLRFYNGQFYSLSSGYGGSNILAASEDGTTWTTLTGSDTYPSPFQQAEVTSLQVSGDSLYLLGEKGNLWRFSESWQQDRQQLLPYQPWDWHAITASPSILVIADQKGHLAWSSDARTYHHLSLPDSTQINDLIWTPGPDLFLAVGGSETTGQLWQSSDAQSWTTTTIPLFPGPINAITWDGSQYLACGNDGQLASSRDGQAWTAIPTGTTENFTDIEFHDNRYAMTATGGLIFYSDDAITWNTHTLGPDTVTYHNLTYGNGIWLISDSYEAHLTTNFLTWWTKPAQAHESDTLFAFENFITSNQRYIVTSPDASYWEYQYEGLHTPHPYPARGGFRHGIRFQDRVIFAGDDGLIAISDPWRDFFAEWQDQTFTQAQLTDPTISAPHADPDQDGWNNIFEYAFDLDPLAQEAKGEAQLFHYPTELFGFDGHQPYTGILGVYRHPWAPTRPGVITWAERLDEYKQWVRTDIVTHLDYRGAANPTFFRRNLKIGPDHPTIIRLRAKLIAPDPR